MRVAVYGGSFNPPHVGHAMVAGWLGWTRRVNQVWLVPAWSHAFGKELAPFPLRVEMCRALAGAVGGWVRVDPVESELPAPSYTIDTLDELARRHPGVELRLVVGADVLEQTSSWKRWDRVEERYRPIVVGRGGWPDVPGAVRFPEISSTEVRERLARGEPVDHLVPSGVLPLARRAFSRR